MKKLAFLSTSDIFCDFTYNLSIESAKKRCKIIGNSTNQPALIVEYFQNRFTLNDKFKNFVALNTLHSTKLVQCHVVQFENSNESDRLLRVLSKSFLDRDVPWELRYHLINQLTSEYKLNSTTISRKLGLNKTVVDKYILEQGIPDYFKELAIQKGYGGPVLNTIFHDAYFSDATKLILYDMAVNDNPRLTIEKFNILKRYLKKGLFLTQNAIDVKQQIREIVEPKNFIETEYWNYINNKYFYLTPIDLFNLETEVL